MKGNFVWSQSFKGHLKKQGFKEIIDEMTHNSVSTCAQAKNKFSDVLPHSECAKTFPPLLRKATGEM